MRTSSHRRQRGIVLLLALVALLLISAVAAALLYMTATESTLVGYQRTTTRVFEAARGGLEEGRARLSTADPSFLGGASFTITFPDAVGQALYILNPAPGDALDLAAVRNAGSPFYDWEYDQEWGAGALAGANVVNPVPPPATPLASDMVALAGLVTLPEIQYKWVRMTILTERAANRDVNGDGVLDNVIPITWDSVSNRMNILTGPPGLLVDRDGDGVPESRLDSDADGVVEVKERLGRYVYRITAFARQAATGSTRMVQYDASAPFVNLAFPAAVSLIGTGSACGYDQGCNPLLMPSGCDSPTNFGPSNALKSHGQDQAPGAPPGEGGPAIGCTDPNACTDCVNELANTMRTADWTGNDGTSGTQTGDVTLASGPLGTTSGLQFLISSIRAMADYSFSAADTPPQVDGNATNDSITPPASSFGNCSAGVNQPKVTVFDGDVFMDAATNPGGCGVLLVTGKLSVQGSWSWKGIILVLGEGSWDSGGTPALQGAQVVARIYCKDGDPAPCPCAGPGASPPLAAPGCQGGGVLGAPYGADFRFNGGGMGGWDYNSMYINNAFGSGSYRVLAYREMGR